MREILFRGKSIDDGEWIYGDLIHNDNIYYPATFIGNIIMSCENTGYLCCDGHYLIEVDPETIGQSTGCREFVMADASVEADLFEGDIVEVCVHRQVGSEGFKSKHDGYCKVRGVIVFRRGEFVVDLNNEYNINLFAAKGNEQYDRDLPSHLPLRRFTSWYNNNNLDWQREHNKNYYYDDIVRIGNIHDNPKLMEDI